MSRRGLLVAGGTTAAAAAAATAGVAAGALPGRSSFYHHLGLDGPDGTVPDVAAGPVLTGVLDSRARDRRCGWSLALPPGTSDPTGLPVAVVLHGRGGDHRTAFAADGLALDRFLAAAVTDGAPSLALASVDGGSAYWHARADGDDPATMVLDELLPLLGDRGVDTDRLAFAGWSMGGYGALHLAGLVGAPRVRAAAAMSPALWRAWDETAPGAFDDADDLRRAGVLDRQSDLDGVAVRVDCGLGDPFCDAAEDYVAGFERRPEGGFERGDHDLGYWRRLAGPHVRFLADALA